MKLNDDLLLSIRQGDNDKVQTILQELSPTELVDDSRTTLLHVAADCGNETITKYLIEKGCQIDAVDDLGNAPLILASKANHINVVRLLLKSNASVLVCNHLDENAAQIVLGGTYTNPLDNIVKGIIVKKIKEQCSSDSSRTAKESLKAGCSLAEAVKLKDVAVTEYMLQNGCNVNDCSNHHPFRTALHEAVLSSDLENVNLLASHGADVNAQDRSGMRPLNLTSNKQILKVLLDHGAEWITDEGTLVEGGLFHHEEFLYLLEKHKLTLSSIKDKRGISLFTWLLGNKNFNVVGKIFRDSIDDSFDVNKTNSGATYLMDATWHGNSDVVEILLNNGANVNARHTRDETTALTRALRRITNETERQTRMEILITLLQHGADVQWIHSRNLTVLDVALQNKNLAMAECILAHLAVMDDFGYEIKNLIREKINSNEKFKSYYDNCKVTINKWKGIVISDRVNLYEFLIIDEKKLITFAHSEDFVSEMQLTMQRESGSNFYYSQVLQRRFSKVLEVVNLQRNTVDTVSEMNELQNNDIILRKIVGYLNYDKLQTMARRSTNPWYKIVTSI